MKSYSYISGKVLTIGGRVVSPEGLTKLDARSLETAIKNKIIKEDAGRKKAIKNGEDPTGKNSEESKD